MKVRTNKVIREARSGDFNASGKSKVIKYLQGLGRDDIEIQRVSNGSQVNWVADVGKTDLSFEASISAEDFVITATDGKGDKIETWKGEIPELLGDVEDSVAFIDEFRNSLGTPAAKKESTEETGDELEEDEDLDEEISKAQRELALAEARVRLLKKKSK